MKSTRAQLMAREMGGLTDEAIARRIDRWASEEPPGTPIESACFAFGHYIVQYHSTQYGLTIDRIRPITAPLRHYLLTFPR